MDEDGLPDNMRQSGSLTLGARGGNAVADFSFVIVTDSHVDVRPERQDGLWWHRSLYSRSTEMFEAAIDEINARQPDFVVHCGDLTNVSDEASLCEGARIPQQLTMPFYVVPGNHDTYDPAARETLKRLLGLGDGPFYRAERFCGWRLILLDSAYWRRKDGSVGEEFLPDDYVDIAVPDEEMAWLRSEFERDGETPTLCFTHTVMAVRESYPVSRMPGGEEVRKRPVKLDEYVTCVEMTDLVIRQPCVKAAFFGHGGWHDCVVRDGTLFCQTAEFVEYPIEMRWVTVFPDRIETEVFGLPDETFARLSYVAEWGNDWSAGRDVDRRMTHRL